MNRKQKKQFTVDQMERDLARLGISEKYRDVFQEGPEDLLYVFMPFKFNGPSIRRQLIKLGWPEDQLFARIEDDDPDDPITEIQFNPIKGFKVR